MRLHNAQILLDLIIALVIPDMKAMDSTALVNLVMAGKVVPVGFSKKYKQTKMSQCVL